MPKSNFQLSLFEADPKFEKVELLSKIDINTVSPVEALLKLNEVILTEREVALLSLAELCVIPSRYLA